MTNQKFIFVLFLIYSLVFGQEKTSSTNTKNSKCNNQKESCCSVKTSCNTAVIPTDKLKTEWWAMRHQQVIDSVRHTNPQLVLLGNSILHSLDYKDRNETWDKYLIQYNAANLGFSADRTENVIWRINNGEIDNMNPKVILLLIGTNNTNGNSFASINNSKELEEATWEICQIIRKKLPDTQILLLGILPFGKRRPNYRDGVNQCVTQLVSKFPNKDNNIHFVDIGNIYLNDNNKIMKDLMPDFLHPNAKGHLLMFKTLQPYIENLMK